MTIQSELILENNLIKQLVSMGYAQAALTNETELLANLQEQLGKHNRTRFSTTEFIKILNQLNKHTSVFERAKVLRDKFALTRDDGTTAYIEFINQEFWCKNEFQVASQVTMEGSYKNRYDVTILINGLPLAQIELKRRGLELKEAYNQVNRYHRHSYGASNGLFLYVQLYVISNGVNTKYYANNKKESFKQTFYWADVENQNITQLESFAQIFLEPCHLAKMVTKYMVLNETYKSLMVLRPYQYYAVEALIDRVKNSTKNGYIWHTTGSGKTLTSFKTSQLLMSLPQVHKIVFVVDRRDLDYQTNKEFNSFSKGSVDETDDTHTLVQKFTDDTKLIITTIQKLNNAVFNKRYLSRMEKLKDERIVFIFDECHRSQFGDTHKRIKSFFNNHQMFGFTGTPIFAENAVGNASSKRTTRELFDDCLHKYVITDAIKDDNVLKFSIEYVGRYKDKADRPTYVDIPVEDIDTQELLDSPKRLEKITDYILANHDRKTHSRTFTGMFCVSSIDTLTKYYDYFRTKKQQGKHNLRIATIFSYGTNEDDKDANGILEEENVFSMAAEPHALYRSEHSRDVLEGYIADYNAQFSTRFSTKDSHSFYLYYNDIAKRVKEKEIDLLLVVNMFLTGFDSKSLNTLYVDKNLKYHGLIQAFSRTNRTLNELKSQGNIVCFRNLKQATDDAIGLFSNKNARDIIIMEPYEDYVAKFNTAYAELLKIAPTVDSVNDLISENDKLAFVQAFRELLRVNNILTSFADFSPEHIDMDLQSFEDYKSKYLDLYESTKGPSKEKVSILDDVDFELELIHRDEINVAYILELLTKLTGTNDKIRKQQEKQIADLIDGTVQLRSKKELIEKFIVQNLPHIGKADDVSEQFGQFWTKERVDAFQKLVAEENLKPAELQTVIENYLYSEREPLRDEIVNTFQEKPKLLERKTKLERVLAKIVTYVNTFFDGVEE
ncbi:MAG: type I restriction endonuclease subunit R [Daejeonella sp.]